MRDRLDPAVLAELEAVDDAVAGGQDDADLALILSEARAAAPRMTPGFADRLEQAARLGFVTAPRPTAGRTSWWTGPRVGVALSGLAALVVAVVLVVGPGGSPRTGGEGGSFASRSTAGDTARTEALPSGKAPSPAASTSAGGSAASGIAAIPHAALAAPDTRRRVERAAQLTLATPARRLQRTVDEVAGVADRLGGYVASSNVAAEGAEGQADFDLRVPVGRLDDALSQLSRLGHVRARSSQVQDVTASFDSARSRLRDARAERGALLRALAKATTQAQIDSIDARLAIARRSIAADRAALAVVRRRAALARVQVTVVGVARGGVAPAAHHRFTPARAVHDALSVLSTAVSVAIVALAAALPALVLALLLALAWRWGAGRRRERALDAAAGGSVSV